MSENDRNGSFFPEKQEPSENIGPAVEENADESNLESFVPTEYFGEEEKPRIRAWLIVLIGVCALLIAGIVAVLCLYLKLKNNPASAFDMGSTQQTVTVAVEETPAPSLSPITLDAAEVEATATPEPTPTPTLNPYEELMQKADTSIMQNILTVCLIGVDYADERETGYGGKARDNAFHADVILLLAINFDENRVDMISLPRDTYTKVPGVEGIYKINASLDCGGGLFAEDGAGFKKVCETASWQLGGIPVNYYYAVTMPAVKQLGDAIGGVDYDLDIDFKIQGRSYTKGLQHMDGQGILDYLRVRKNIAQSGDNNRVKRQKKMLTALFQSMKDQNLILKIPDILSAFDGQLYTNTTLEQTAALALFAYNLDSENIGMYSMGSGSDGTSGVTNIFNWNFCITDQNNRVNLIKQIYGIDVPQHLEYSRTYAWYRWDTMLAKKALTTCTKLTSYAEKVIAEDDKLPEGPSEGEETPAPDPSEETPAPGGETPAPDPSEETPAPEEETPAQEGDDSPAEGEQPTALQQTKQSAFARLSAGRVNGNISYAVRTDSTGTRQYTESDRELFEDYLHALNRLEAKMEDASDEAAKYLKEKSNHLSSANDELEAALANVKELAVKVANTFGYSESKLNWYVAYETDTDFNEVTVNFN